MEKIVTWMKDIPDRPVNEYMEIPDDLSKIGAISPDWKRLKLDQLCAMCCCIEKCKKFNLPVELQIKLFRAATGVICAVI